MKKTECFKINVGEMCSKDDLFDLASHRSIKKIKCDTLLTTFKPKTIIADPFLFVWKDTLYLFYEDKRYAQSAVLSMIATNDLVHWTKPCVVLTEECHLSYPYVFADGDNVYMIPETSGLNEIRLYKANDKLTEFSYVSTLIKDNIDRISFSYSDSSIIKKDGLYYIFTTVCDICNELKLYYSENLVGPYIEHISSPLIKNNWAGRNAGALFYYQNKLYRVAQDCVEGYGENIHLFEVKMLTQNEYVEELVIENLIDRKCDFYKNGGHQFNCVKYRDKYIIATDAKEYHIFLVARIINKIKKMWKRK